MNSRVLTSSLIGIAALASAAIFVAACTDNSAGIDSGHLMQFEVKQTGDWVSPQSAKSRAESHKESVYILYIDDSTDTLSLHTSIGEDFFHSSPSNSRAQQITSSSIENFQVMAYMKNAAATSEAELYMSDIISKSGANWLGTENYFWPGNNFSLKFYAYAPADIVGITPPECPQTTFSYTVPTNFAEQDDLMISTYPSDGYISGNQTDPIDLSFDHVLTAVKFVFAADSDEGTISAIRIKNVYTQADYSFDENKWGNWSNTSPVFELQLTDQNITTGSVEASTDGNFFMMLPQTLPEDAIIEIDYQPIKASQPKTLKAPIGGLTWTKGETTSYVITILPTYEYVDLGLSTVYWAKTNIGANSPGEFGNLYYWGATKPYNSGEEGSSTASIKESYSPESGYDAARVNWRGKWRVPTEQDFKDLLDTENFEWEEFSKDASEYGVSGWKVTSKKNGNHIFLPAAGCGYQAGILIYWTSTYNSGYTFMGDHNIMDTEGLGTYSNPYISSQYVPIRPVLPKN